MNLKMYSRALKVRGRDSQGSPRPACSTYCVSTASSFLQGGISVGIPALHPLSQRCPPPSQPPPCPVPQNALVGERGAEVLADVGLQDRVEMLEFSVSHQRHDENLRAASRGMAWCGQGDVWAEQWPP